MVLIIVFFWFVNLVDLVMWNMDFWGIVRFIISGILTFGYMIYCIRMVSQALKVLPGLWKRDITDPYKAAIKRLTEDKND